MRHPLETHSPHSTRVHDPGVYSGHTLRLPIPLKHRVCSRIRDLLMHFRVSYLPFPELPKFGNRRNNYPRHCTFAGFDWPQETGQLLHIPRRAA